MTHLPESTRVFRFGLFAFDSGSLTLTKRGVRIKLHDQPARLLLTLLDKPGEIVRREELYRQLWSADTYVEFEHSLNIAMNKVRIALSDSATNPRFVETVHRKGYRFIAQVETVKPENGGTASTANRGFRMAGWAAAGACVVVLLAAAGWFFRVKTSQSSAPVVVPFTTLPGAEWTPRFSPDGQQVAFTWDGPAGDNYDIYIKRIDSEEMVRVTSDPAVEACPVWSPDGAWIAYARALDDNRWEMHRINLSDRVSRQITEFRGPSDAALLSWGSDGRWLAFTNAKQDSSHSYAIHLISLETGHSRQLTFPPSDIPGDIGPAVSPDGQSIAFLRQTTSQSYDIYLLRLTPDLAPAGPPVRLLKESGLFNFLAWTPDGESLLLNTRSSIQYLARLRLGSQRLERLDFAGERAIMPAVAQRAKRMAFVRGKWDTGIWTLKMGTDTPPVAALWPGSSSYLDRKPRFSPDGRKVAFVSNRSGQMALWVAEASGTNAVRLTDVKSQSGDLNWTPDGKRIVFSDGKQAYSVDAMNGTIRHLAVPGVVLDDGQWLYYTSKKTGRDEIWKAQPDGSEPRQLTHQGGKQVQVISGGHLYYIRDSERPNPQPKPGMPSFQASLWRLPTAGGREEKVIEALYGHSNFAVVAGGIYFIPPADPDYRTAIQFLRFPERNITVVKTLDKPLDFGLTVSPDGRSVLYVQIDEPNSDVMLVKDFQ